MTKKPLNLMKDVVDPLMAQVDDAIEPKKMGRAEALEALDLIVGHCRDRMECLQEEMADE